jgi:hypothetical protein
MAALRHIKATRSDRREETNQLNLSLGMSDRHFTSLINDFPKKLDNQIAAVALDVTAASCVGTFPPS